jgi:hypothetical protein
MTRLRSLALAGGLVLLSACLAVPAHAQQWRQEIQIITPIQFGDPTHVFLDSVDAVLARTPDLRVRRQADSTAMSYRSFRESLYEDGVDLRSATHALIRYRFDLTEQGYGVVETIEELYFIFRVDESRVDIPILYLNTRDPNVSALLTDHGIPSMVNMLSVTPFRKLMAYPYLNERYETAIVEFGGRATREALPARQAMVLTLIDEHMSVGTYVLSTAHNRMAAATP